MPRWQRKKNSADHMIMINRRVCNRRVCNMQRASERAVASFANLAHTILRRLSFSTDRSYKLLGRQLRQYCLQRSQDRQQRQSR